VAEAVRLGHEHEIVGFLDDTYPERREVSGIAVLGSTKAIKICRSHSTFAVVAIGDNRVRQRLVQDLQEEEFVLPAIIHPGACVSPSAVLEPGVTVMAGSIVNTEAQAGTGVIVNAGAVVDHHTTLEPFSHLGAGCCVAGGNTLKEGVWLRAGCVMGYDAKTLPWEVYAPGTHFGE
jgi:UDP-3-O-[3-hydroxymyristoyl] glucosamine N-acyltransferase